MTARTFISAYRFDPVRVLFVRRALPVLVWISVFGALLVPVLVLSNLWQGVAPEAHDSLLLYLGGMALVMLTAPALLQWFVWHTRRDMFETDWQLDDTGIQRRRGRRVARRRWSEVHRIDTLALGRLQMARVRTERGSLWFDAAMVDAAGPPPQLKWGALRFSLVWPDGRERPLEIEACELYRAIAERLAERG